MPCDFTGLPCRASLCGPVRAVAIPLDTNPLCEGDHVMIAEGDHVMIAEGDHVMNAAADC